MIMNDFDEGFALLEEKFGNGKDNILSLATIALEAGTDGSPRPVVRGVDALYEDGFFYNHYKQHVKQDEAD